MKEFDFSGYKMYVRECVFTSPTETVFAWRAICQSAMIRAPDNDRRDNMPADGIDSKLFDDPISSRTILERWRLFLTGIAIAPSIIDARIEFIGV